MSTFVAERTVFSSWSQCGNLVEEIDSDMTSSNDIRQISDDGQSDGGDRVKRDGARRWLEPFHCSRDLLANKMFYFAYLGMLGVFYPYSPVYLKQHGLSAFEIGLTSGIKPLIGFLSAPVCGAIADQFRIRRLAMIVSLIAGFAFFSSLFAVRGPQRRGECPKSFELFLSHPNIHTALHRDLAVDYNSNVSFVILATDVAFSSPSTTTTENVATAAAFQPQTLITSNFVHNPLTSNRKQHSEPSGNPNGDISNTSLVSEEDQRLLRADLDWLYKPASRYHVFIVCFVIICSAELFQAPTMAMSDAATLQILGRERLHEYGAHRAWGPRWLGSQVSTYLLHGRTWFITTQSLSKHDSWRAVQDSRTRTWITLRREHSNWLSYVTSLQLHPLWTSPRHTR